MCRYILIMVGMLNRVARLPNIKFIGINMGEFVRHLRIFQVTGGFTR